MEGYQYFMSLFYQLDEQERKKFLERVFDVVDVSLYTIVKRENRCIFRIYANHIFYQFVFDGASSCKNKLFTVHKESRFVCYFFHANIRDSVSLHCDNYAFLIIIKILFSHCYDEALELFRCL